MLDKLRNSKLYQLALTRRISTNTISILYKSKNFKVIEDDFFETLLVGYEILNKANQKGFKIS